MDQLKKLIATLSWPQRAGILAVALLSVGAILGLVHWRHEQDFRPLFTGMAPEDAAAVVQKLKEGGIEYRIAGDGSTVLAPAEKIDELRLEMAEPGCRNRAGRGLSSSIRRIWASPTLPSMSIMSVRSRGNWSAASKRSAKWSRRACILRSRKTRSFWTPASPLRPAFWCGCAPGRCCCRRTCKRLPIWSLAPCRV